MRPFTQVYKVVWEMAKPTGEHVLVGSIPMQGRTVTYSTTETTYPFFPGSYLYAFDSLDSATAYWCINKKEYKHSLKSLQIWLADAEVVPVKTPVAAWRDSKQFWEEQWFSCDYPVGKVIPCAAGTVWCYSIRLISRVDVESPVPA